MKIKTGIKIIAVLLMVVMLLAVSSCGTDNKEENNSSTYSADLSKDREGNPITLPRTIDNIISIGPSTTEILVELGCGNKIIAVDTYSENVNGIKSNLPMFSMIGPDGEQIINLQPDVIFVTGMSKAGGDDSFKVVEDAGICVIYIPSSSSIEAIKEDILYIAEVMKAKSKGQDIISDMENEISKIKKIGDTITEKKKVYFEISAAPYLYSFGKGVFLNEMIELIGAVNIFENQESWIAVTEESVLDANPDVILTSVDYVENPADEIKSRAGWSGVPAVQNNAVSYINADESNRPSHNIIKALKEMAKAIYPDKY